MSSEKLAGLIRRDIAANRGYPKSILILMGFRLTHHLRERRGLASRIAYIPTVSIYKFVSEWLFGVEIPAATKIGSGLRLRHGIGVVINPAVTIGEDVMIRQNVTLGNRREDFDCPVIGDHVELGAGATVIGRCTVGDRARVGAGALVLQDIPAGGVAYSPAATIRAPREID